MCGIFGVFNMRKAAEITAIGLHGNQHRARDYAGIVSTDGSNIYRQVGTGLVRQVFTSEMLESLHGNHALGHVRYPTVSDARARDNIQPVLGTYGGETIALVHNGNLTNTDELKTLVAGKPATSMDSEYILRLLPKRNHVEGIESDLAEVFRVLKGSYALGILLHDRLLAVRDPSGNRPLSIGQANGSYFISSETCAFANVGAHYLRDVQPGEIVSITKKGITSTKFSKLREKRCRFEGIYFSEPTSEVFGESVMQFRLNLGEALEKVCPAPLAEICMGIPDSALFIAQGYGRSGKSGRYHQAVTRNHDVGRTFIAATQAQRDEEISQKFKFSEREIRGKRIALIDDSIVRGSTLPKVVNHLRFLGASEVHVRVGSPPMTDSCHYGINTPDKSKLIAAHKSVEEIRTWAGADSLAYLPLEVLQSLSPEPEKYCYACMTGVYWDT